MIERVTRVLEMAEMVTSEQRKPARLSGRPKSNVAIAGVTALEPSVIILDEATSMLDPKGTYGSHWNNSKLHKEKTLAAEAAHENDVTLVCLEVAGA